MPYKRIASFDGYFYKGYFLYWLLDLDDFFFFLRIFFMREKLNLLYINIVSMLYIGGNEYNLKTNFFMAKDEKNACYQLLSYGL